MVHDMSRKDFKSLLFYLNLLNFYPSVNCIPLFEISRSGAYFSNFNRQDGPCIVNMIGGEVYVNKNKEIIAISKTGSITILNSNGKKLREL